ncbi:MAG: NADH-dependent [FeFe] hydrogenase, group A6 [Candidatus Gastranaerophilales bacterium]|nr:NADH-dependent [FeFe] hydrogenase, group A6 [Candidatus Gastranaerophilales bacterium]
MKNNSDKKLYIDGREIEFSDERNLLEVIRKAGIEVPTLCYRPDLTIYGACRMCVVEIEGRGVQSSCTVPPESGMKVKVNTEKTRRVRKISLELILSNHDRECTTCEKSSNCELQDLSNKMGIKDIRFGKREEVLPIDNSNPSIVRDPNKCILCGACVRVCKETQGQGVLDFANRGAKVVVTPAYGKNLDESDCVYCGQCTTVCPTGALTIKSDIKKVWNEILDEKKIVIAQVAPAVRVAFGEVFGIPAGENTIGLITAALRKIGFDKVFDTSFAADMTVMEEGTELISRLLSNEKLPLFTSCCPAWVKFAEQRYPEYLENLSTCKSPQQMFGSIAKDMLTKELDVKKENLTVVSIMPCTAKKAEAKRSEFLNDKIADVDVVITTQELIKMIQEAGIDIRKLEAESMDSPFGTYTGAALIFGSSGGVAEAAIRMAYEFITGKKLEKVAITETRGLKTLKELTVDIEGRKVRLAIVNTLGEAKKLMDRIKKGEASYDVVEVMACPGGCIGGAGQPSSNKTSNAKACRAKGLYEADDRMPLHKSQENPQVQEIYGKELEKPNSKLAHELLHTHYNY